MIRKMAFTGCRHQGNHEGGCIKGRDIPWTDLVRNISVLPNSQVSKEAGQEPALLEGDVDSAADCLQEIDRKTANEMVEKAGQTFGFLVMGTHGIVYTHMGMLSRVFGYADIL